MLQQICRNEWCKKPFEVTDGDLSFYEKVSPVLNGVKEQLPPPSLCRDCRQIRRMSWRNERHLYSGVCLHCKKNKLSSFAPGTKRVPFCQDCLYKDDWDAMQYGKEFDFSKTFAENMRELLETVPAMMTYHSGISQNCDYMNFAGTDCKNCYMIFNTGRSEDCYYCRGLVEGDNCADMMIGSKDRFCYGCINCSDCYQLSFSENSFLCSESAFLYNCRRCKNCFGCTNLVEKQYCIWNEQKTPEEFNALMQQLGSYSFKQEMTQRYLQMRSQAIHRATNNINTEDSSGDYITTSKNCHECYEVTSAEDCKNLMSSKLCKDCHDILGFGYDSQLLYEDTSVGLSTNAVFCFTCDNLLNAFYCFSSQSLKDCFGCVSLHQKQYCILNEQYSKEEYEQVAAKIINHMRSTGEWGEYLSSDLSPYSYNETIANEYYPTSQQDALARGWKWNDYQAPPPNVSKIIPAVDLPDAIQDIPDDILSWAIECEATKRPFRVIKQELDFYRKMNLPVPRFHPDERYYQRLALTNPRRLWTRSCMKCKEEMQTTYAPERPETVYCENCYQEAVY